MALNLTLPGQMGREELKPRITVFGVGGAGGNAVNNMIEKELQGVEFVVANTDSQALAQSRSNARIQLGVRVTEGLGAGARPNVGAAAAEETIEEIVDHLAGAHMCFITAGMGGGTGTGAAPIIAQAARELGVLTVGVVTKPFHFEGSKRMKQAMEGIEALQRVVDTLIIIPNQNLFRVANEKTTFTEAFALADDVLYQGVKGVTDLMVRPGLVNLDFADIRSVMNEMGKCMMGTGEASGEDRAIQAAEKAIANPLLDEISLKGAKGVLINITGGYDLTLFEYDEAANRIREEVDPEANIMVGSSLDPDMEGLMRVAVVATGIDAVAGTAEVPVPKRRMAEPNPVAQRTEEPVAQPVEAQQRAPQLAAEPEPTLFQHLEPVEEEQRWEAETDDLPPPAYSAAAVAAAAARAQAQQTAASETYVAPAAQRPGTPSPEALRRLQQAVNRVPARQPQVAPPAAQAPAADRGRFGLNSLINRMTGGTPADAERPGFAQRPQAAQPAAHSSAQAPQRRVVAEEPEADPDHERIEIPAFLRRQAN